MAIKVLIIRQFKEGKADAAYELLTQLRSMATLQKGYISGQTLVSSDTPNKVVVVSTWSGPKRWEDWRGNSKRQEYSKKLEEFLVAPEHVEVFLTSAKSEE
jgi:heme-degrading monooxygenase HmoA